MRIATLQKCYFSISVFIRNDVFPFKTAAGSSKLWSENSVDSIHIFGTSQEMTSYLNSHKDSQCHIVQFRSKFSLKKILFVFY